MYMIKINAYEERSHTFCLYVKYERCIIIIRTIVNNFTLVEQLMLLRYMII